MSHTTFCHFCSLTLKLTIRPPLSKNNLSTLLSLFMRSKPLLTKNKMNLTQNCRRTPETSNSCRKTHINPRFRQDLINSKFPNKGSPKFLKPNFKTKFAQKSTRFRKSKRNKKNFKLFLLVKRNQILLQQFAIPFYTHNPTLTYYPHVRDKNK